jgi:hypothetical protein
MARLLLVFVDFVRKDDCSSMGSLLVMRDSNIPSDFLSVHDGEERRR